MRYRVTHKTTYRYSEPASLSQNELYLQPRDTAWQRVFDNRMTILPAPQYQYRRRDYFGNVAHMFMLQHPHDQLVVTAESTVETAAADGVLPEDTLAWEGVVRQLTVRNRPELLAACQFTFASPLIAISDPVRQYAKASFAPATPVLAGALDLMQRIYTEFTYDKAATTVDTPVDRVLADRKGVCQDFAHLAIACLRSLGLAARYVSGYLETQPPPGAPKLVGADASHAWVSLFVPDAGWVDLDPTNNLMPAHQHITLAWGRDYADVTPVKGVVMGGGKHDLTVMVDVAAQE